MGVTVISLPQGEEVLATNLATNTTYVASSGVAVVAGFTPLQFVPATPCRLVDTRTSGGPIQGGTWQSFPVVQEGNCNIPNTAAAYSLNVTVVPQGPLGYLTIWPDGQFQPLVSTMNSLDGRIKANAAIVPAGGPGASQCLRQQHDQTSCSTSMATSLRPADRRWPFYSLAPCRVLDTRKPMDRLGGPLPAKRTGTRLPGAGERLPVSRNTAEAYSLNFTVVPYNDYRGLSDCVAAGRSQAGGLDLE